jgi:serine protease inhibitor
MSAVSSFLIAQEPPSVPVDSATTPTVQPANQSQPTETLKPADPSDVQPQSVEIPKLPFPKEGFPSAASVQFLAYNTYSQLAATQKNKNFCFSPLLLAKQLTVLRCGVNNHGKTADGFFNVFPVNMTNQTTADLAGNFNQMSTAVFRQGIKIPSNTPATFVQINAVWVPANYPIVEQYLDGIKTFFRTDLYAVDFTGNRNDAINTLNAWSRDCTNGKIPIVIDESIKASLPDDVSVVTTGIAASSPRLLTPFHQQNTTEQEFTAINGEKKKTPVMRQITSILYLEVPELAQIISLPCVEENLYFIVLLPVSGKLDTLERQMTPTFLGQVFARLQTQIVDFTLPKMTLTSCLDLTPTVRQLGLQTAASPDADFSLMSQSKENPLKLTNLLHETQVTLAETAAQPQKIPQATARFYTNRPFVLIVWNTNTATPLILGRVVDL